MVALLEGAGIPYMISGSLVSSLQGEPRATHDIDLVIDLTTEHRPALLTALRDLGGYVSDEAVQTAVADRGMFNYIDSDSGIKVDFWMLTDDLYDLARFARRRRESFLGLWAGVSAPEDTILMKLRWSKLTGGSEKQFRDALRVFEVQRGNLDRPYLDLWAQRLGIEDDWNRLQEEAGTDLEQS